MTATQTLVKPGTCRRCKGNGYSNWGPQDGLCYGCGGTGQVETDRATLAARKARQETSAALLAAAQDHSVFATIGFTNLAVADPARFEKALASFEAGHPGLLDALDAYGRPPRRDA